MNTEWWKDAIVYQIYPRSFQDSNGDGIGDLQGIIKRLDYIKNLGIDTIWMCPVYLSPGVDNGYDISDYQKINPVFGSMQDFDELLDEVHSRGMRLIMDLVVNHTSDQHPWFQHARMDKNSEYHDYYIWRSGENGVPPNNWGSWFGGSAWEYNQPTDEYYLHIFAKGQPDLNWSNKNLRQRIYNMMDWWLVKGIDGFRMDVISLISKPNIIPNDGGQDLSPYCINGPHVHEYLSEMNDTVLSHYDVMTVGECPGITIEEAKKYAGSKRGELNMVFQFEHTSLTDGEYGKWTDKRTNLPALKRVFKRWQQGLHNDSWNCLFWDNHDQPRAVSKFGNDLPEYRDLSAKMLCACLYLMQGTPFIFQGQELGMTNPGFFDLAQYRDIESINAYHDFVDSGTLDKRTMLNYLARTSRDNARTPMQWTSGACAGFTTGDPWISLGRNWRAVNAERELTDPFSVYNFYREVLHFRKNNDLIKNGSFSLLYPDHEQVFAYRRELNNERLEVYCNFDSENITLEGQMVTECDHIVFSNYKRENWDGSSLFPYEVIVLNNKTSHKNKV